MTNKPLFIKSFLITMGIILGVILFAIGILYFKSKIVHDPSEDIIKCISENSVLYVQAGCPHCETQKQKFGDKLELLNIIDCTKDTEECISKGIRFIPTWIFNNTYIEGDYSIEELKEMMNC